jgi:hypothetical protein
MTIQVVVIACAATLLLAVPAAASDVDVGWFSQQVAPGQARIGASIRVSQGRAGGPSRPGSPQSPTGASGTAVPAIPTLKSTSPLLQRTHPVGRGSFWYTTLDGHRCIYVADSPGPCYIVVTPGDGPPAQPALSPAAVAAAAAERLTLGPGQIEASPAARAHGLTGAASWFWLDPSPAVRSVSVSVGRERVTVTASARDVRWAFGDGSSLVGGPGVPYRSGAAPSGAVRHDYETRCLPGDQGHDPYVLSTCGARGYTVTAELVWDISYEASGPVSGSGSLPSRTTTASLAYPVSEARGFLTTGGGG